MTAASSSNGQNGRRQPATAELDFRPLFNGVDFLGSAITHLLKSDDPRSLKYAVLHLQAAIEIMVKVRLQREGIQHVFDDPYSVDETKFRNGQFKSVTLTAALRRLEKVAGIALSKKDKKAFENLGEERNKLQHFGSTSSHDLVNTRAGQALDVLSEFIAHHVMPGAPADDQLLLAEAEELIKQALTEIASVTQARLERITSELDNYCGGIVIACPDCEQIAWMFEPGGDSRCLFCNCNWEEYYGWDVAEEYANNILGDSRHLAGQGKGDWLVRRCPTCYEEAFVDVLTRNGPDKVKSACFQCGLVTFPENVVSCADCGRPMLDGDELSMCKICFEHRMAED